MLPGRCENGWFPIPIVSSLEFDGERIKDLRSFASSLAVVVCGIPLKWCAAYRFGGVLLTGSVVCRIP